MKYKHPSAHFEVTFPNKWVRNHESEFFHFLEPEGDASLTMTAYADEEGFIFGQTY